MHLLLLIYLDMRWHQSPSKPLSKGGPIRGMNAGGLAIKGLGKAFKNSKR
jgi:hypothetical protein